LKRTAIDKLEKAGDFPRRINLTGKAVGWIDDEVTDWIQQQAEKRINA